MTEAVNLTGDIALAVDGALERQHPLVIAYVDEHGHPSQSFRGSTQVHGPQQLAVWARQTDSGLAAAIADRPAVSAIYFGPGGPGPHYLSIKGRAHVDPSANEQVYAKMPEREKQGDPEAKGVAVIIDVDSVAGGGENGFFTQSRD